ncbi:exonuclease domain-containing protein [Ascidiimonas aurantiaca]|uniref:exonuclease domain-containing protein n=1 Tax=Ascidiimonas aurantiaca TaxID=1685432 RepID=UPI0030ECC05D
MYAIVDVETTGLGGDHGNRITEIAIIIHNGKCIINKFHTLVNPETALSPYVTGLTGITEDMVREAPVFADIVEKVDTLMHDHIFVAHSVNFDYNIIKKEYARLGKTFQRKKLCTVRLSRQLFPGFKSYSLGNLCSQLNISIYDRHRAMGDAEATVILFEKLLYKDQKGVIQYHLNVRSGESTLPPLLPRATYEQLPEAYGVYYFKDAKGTVIYVGKAKNLKKRVLGHFYDKSERELALCRETAHIDFELAGSELLALLIESYAIKKFYPKYNRAQKQTQKGFTLVDYTNRAGIWQLGYVPVRSATSHTSVCFYTVQEAITFLEDLSIRFSLCPKYAQLQNRVVHCSHYRVPVCKGICREKETVHTYNQRVLKALQWIKTQQEEEFIIKEKGRTTEEYGFVWVSGSRCKGYGFIDTEATVTRPEDLENWLLTGGDNTDVKRIIDQYMRREQGNTIFRIS